MDVALPGFILGYHGCDAKVAKEVIAGKRKLKSSTNDYDWLGDGIYFWEHNAQRAFEFAKQMKARPHPSGQKVDTPAVIGAVIDLGYCLNMLDNASIKLVRSAYEEFEAIMNSLKQPMPVNKGGSDLVDRKLDCAVINFLHGTREGKEQRPYETVRAAFFEGKPLYENSGFAHRNHIQVAVRDPARILGYFLPLDEKGKVRKFR